MPEPPSAWFGEHTVPHERMIRVKIGPRRLWIAHRTGEWRIAWNQVESEVAAGAVGDPEAIADPDPGAKIQRFATQRSSDRIILRPLLADRPVVTRPETLLAVPGGDETLIYVSTPVWVRVVLPDPERVLLDLPATRPSDTWIGRDTRSGTVAYASRTAARLDFENLPPLPHRAITPVRLRNEGYDVLVVERLAVPAPNLPLYADRADYLWTAPLVATREVDARSTRVEVESHPPREAAGAELVAEPRDTVQRGVFSRALHVLVG